MVYLYLDYIYTRILSSVKVGNEVNLVLERQRVALPVVPQGTTLAFLPPSPGLETCVLDWLLFYGGRRGYV